MTTFKEIFIYRGFHRILGTRTSSRWFGKFADARIYPPLLRLLIRGYVRMFGIDLSEYAFDYKNVTTFNAFFTRKLKPGMRTWGEGICSPVDGTLLSHGTLENDRLFQVKGMSFSQLELTGKPGFDLGSFVNLYLSPGDYHRIHAPFDLLVEEIRHFPGLLLSVSEKNAGNIENLYNKNERIVLKGRSPYGTCFIVLVGATNVGSIGLTHFPELKTNLREKTKRTFPVKYTLKKGEELGWFAMGSTVLIIMEGPELSKLINVRDRNKIRLGTTLSQPSDLL